MAPIWVPISSVALAVCEASAFTSLATTAKPRPASPARAASIVALSASRLVCSAIAVMSFTTSPMRPAACDSSLMRASVFFACCTASPAMRADSWTWRLISVTDEVISSAAEATDWTLVEASSEAAATEAGQLLGHFRGAGQRAGGGLELARGGRNRVDDAADRALELVGELSMSALRCATAALLALLPLGFHRLDLDQLLLEGFRGARIVADLVAALRIGHVDRLVAVRALEQHLADAPDRPRDRTARRRSPSRSASAPRSRRRPSSITLARASPAAALASASRDALGCPFVEPARAVLSISSRLGVARWFIVCTCCAPSSSYLLHHFLVARCRHQQRVDLLGEAAHRRQHDAIREHVRRIVDRFARALQPLLAAAHEIGPHRGARILECRVGLDQAPSRPSGSSAASLTAASLALFHSASSCPAPRAAA